MALDDMSPEHIGVFRSVIDSYPGVFGAIIQWLEIGTDNDKVRWTQDSEFHKGFDDPERLRRTKWGKVSKASKLYEYDVDKVYVIHIIEQIWNSMDMSQKQAFAFYLLAHINIYWDKSGNRKYGLNSPYAAERLMTANISGYMKLPSPEDLAQRLGEP